MLVPRKISPIVMSNEGVTESNNATQRNEEDAIVTAIIEEAIPYSTNTHNIENDVNLQEQPNSEGICMKTLDGNAMSTSPQDPPEPILQDNIGSAIVDEPTSSSPNEHIIKNNVDRQE